MGFFSWNCKGCGESIKAPYNLPKELTWQNSAVAYAGLYDSDSVIYGSYSGYGMLETDHGEIGLDLDDVCIWHERCYEADLDMYPTEDYSRHAEDQGYFYDRPGDED